MNGLIRSAEAGDASALAALDALCFAVPWSRNSFQEELTRNRLARYLIAESETGEPIGYAGIWLIMDEGHITNIAVHPSFRGQGVGTQLLQSLLELAETAGAVRQTLEVRPSNCAALRLYGKFGFREEGRRKEYYEDNGEDALILWRKQE